MRILHVTPYMHARAGGPPVVIENFIHEASKLGHRSEIISTDLFCNDEVSGLLHRLNQVAPTTLLSSSALSIPLAKHKIAQSVQAADIIHVHTIWSPINIFVRRACARHGRPFVLMPHGMLDPYSLSVRRWRKTAYFLAFERKNLLASRRLIYTTPEEARLVTSAFPSLPKGIVISLGGDAPLAERQHLATQFVERFPIAHGRRSILFLGRLEFKKGIDRILAGLPSVISAFPDLLLIIAGEGAPRFVAELNGRIVAEGLQQNVLMTGRLDGILRWGAYAHAELFVLPSRQENFAIALAEAMHMSLPVVIGSRVNSWTHVRKAGAGIIVDEGRMDSDLGGSLLSLLQDPAKGRQMGKHGRDYARNNLTWRHATALLMECYAEVLTTD